MIETLIIFACCFTYFGIKKLIQTIEQQAYERRRFYLMVQAELDNMDKVSKDFIQRQISTDVKKWVGRN